MFIIPSIFIQLRKNFLIIEILEFEIWDSQIIWKQLYNFENLTNDHFSSPPNIVTPPPAPRTPIRTILRWKENSVENYGGRGKAIHFLKKKLPAVQFKPLIFSRGYSPGTFGQSKLALHFPAKSNANCE